MMEESPWEAFRSHSESLGVPLSPQQILRVKHFHTMLLSANEQLNLTRITSLDEAILKHYLDTVLLVSVLSSRTPLSSLHTILDLGSGGGVPGIVLALILPSLEELVLVEARAKKLAFLRRACIELEIPLTAIHDRWNRKRALKWAGEHGKVDLVTARAVSEPISLIRILAVVSRNWLVLPRGPSESEDLFHESGTEASRSGFEDGRREYFRMHFGTMEMQRQIWAWKYKEKQKRSKKA